MKGVERLPRYRDPVTRNVARLLLRSLQEQHRAPSSCVVEFEARLGRLVGQVTRHRTEFPVVTATAAVLDSAQSSLYAFEAGVPRSAMAGVELALREKGVAVPSDVGDYPKHYESSDVHFITNGKHRLTCTVDVLPQMLEHARRTRNAGSSSSSSSLAAVELRTPFAMSYAAMVQAATDKQRLALLDLCCPGWCADLRFAVSTETAVPVEPHEVLEVLPAALRFRNRGTFPVSPLFTVHLTESFLRYDMWWHPFYNLPDFCDPSVAAYAGVGTVIPMPYPFVTKSKEQRQRYNPHARPHAGATTSTSTHEVEVEVNVKALLQMWKKVYGGAAASAYLSSAEPVATTIAGTTMNSSTTASSFASTPLRAEELTEAEVRAFTLAEREDPFLLRVAEDFMALVQFVGQLRVMD